MHGVCVVDRGRKLMGLVGPIRSQQNARTNGSEQWRDFDEVEGILQAIRSIELEESPNEKLIGAGGLAYTKATKY